MHCSTLLHWNWTRLFERPTPMLLTWLQELFSHGQEVSKTRPHFFLFSGMGDLTRFLLLLESCQLVFFRLLRRCKLWSPDFKFSARGFWFPMWLGIFLFFIPHIFTHFAPLLLPLLRYLSDDTWHWKISSCQNVQFFKHISMGAPTLFLRIFVIFSFSPVA